VAGGQPGEVRGERGDRVAVDSGAVTTGSRSTLATRIVVEEVPTSALLELKETAWTPLSAKVGRQRNVPLPFPAATVKVAPWPAGRPARFATSDDRGSPSGSDAFTVTTISWSSWPVAVTGDVTTGARSTLVTEITVVAPALSALTAVKLTL
jgi:hypothetical protein